MHRALFALGCAVLLADATQKFPQLRHVRRDGPLPNGTGSYNTTTITAPSLLPTFPPEPFPITPPLYPANYTFYQNTSTATGQDSCSGSVTYLNSVPPTVYSTVTESFLVTVSASNASLPPPEITTPAVACTAIVVPLVLTGSWLPAYTTLSSVNSACPEGVCFPGISSTTSEILSFQPALTIITLSLAPALVSASIVPQIASNAPQIATNSEAPLSPAASTGSAFTSTVLVTKKTPVPVVVSSTSAPPVFQIISTTKNPPTTSSPGAKGGSTSPNPTSKGPTPNAVGAQPATTTSIGNIIASIINSPFTPVGSGATPVTTTLNNVPVQVLASSVVIGGQILSIPGKSSTTTLQVNGQTFTVQNSEIIAPGTTLAITPERNQEVSATTVQSAVTAAGLTFSVGASQAVISGTTYAIGNGAGSKTTVVVGGETLTIGSSGVILPSTTVAPLQITAAPLAPEIITAGGIILTVGPSLVVVSGSTYAIGPGAKSTSIVIGGETISIGSNGIGLASTTIAPEPDFTVITVGGLTFSVDSSEAILGGTTYHIGKGASTTTKVVDGKTISLGPSGVGLPSTTIPPETGAAPTSTGEAQGIAASCSFSRRSALLALIVGMGAIGFF